MKLLCRQQKTIPDSEVWRRRISKDGFLTVFLPHRWGIPLLIKRFSKWGIAVPNRSSRRESLIIGEQGLLATTLMELLLW